MVARLGLNGQLVVAGAVAVVLADVIGVLTQDWSLELNHWLLILGSIAATAIVLTGSVATIAGLPMRTYLRIDGAIVAAFGLIELGDLLSSLTQWGAIDIVLTIVEVVGAAVLAVGAWALSGGSLIRDVTGVAGALRMEMIDRFVYLGAVGVVVGWFLLMAIADVYNFNAESQVAVLAAVLVLCVRWLGRNPAAGALPLSAPMMTAGLGAVAVLVGLWWFVQIIGRTLEIGDITTFVPLLVYVLALIALGLGAFLGLGRLPAPAARS
ncbi:MAG: hypothetical protein L0227_05885 [Chloroflexi bacterium]|nr:hypothetical protein [Chloroflexota bacterium]